MLTKNVLFTYVDSRNEERKTSNCQASGFATKGDGKIFLIQSERDRSQAIARVFNLFDLKDLPGIWKSLKKNKFISSWDLNESYVPLAAKDVHIAILA